MGEHARRDRADLRDRYRDGGCVGFGERCTFPFLGRMNRSREGRVAERNRERDGGGVELENFMPPRLRLRRPGDTHHWPVVHSWQRGFVHRRRGFVR